YCDVWIGECDRERDCGGYSFDCRVMDFNRCR
ncbi:uncharacterized protein METZ01_LOCUS205089, partial [marine metagenome]